MPSFKKGYTLIEFLIVTGILSLSVGSILLLLTSVIKGANQANVTSEIKQNGQVILDSLEKQIRSATDVTAMTGSQLNPTGAGSVANSGVILNLSTGERISIICFNAVSTTSNGWIGIAKSSAGGAVPPDNVTGYQSLTNQSTVSGVDINCDADPSATVSSAFSVNPVGAAAKVVIVNFIASQGVTAPSRADFVSNAQFKTTVSLRQYQ